MAGAELSVRALLPYVCSHVRETKPKPHLASAAMATAFFGLLVATEAIGLVSYLDQFLGALSVAPADLPLDVAVMVMAVAAIGALNTAVAFIHVRIYNGRPTDAVSRRTLDIVCFAVCSSISVLLPLIFVLQPGAMDGAQDLLPLALAVAFARALLPAAAAVTFFVSIMLIYAHLRTGVADARNTQITTSVKLLTRVILAAALVTVVLSLIAAIAVFYTE
ncbi:hypothetical protein E2562_029881 [Oryza meyeriana var. granulata]|uniref:Uncharacterized protein n=1 Tax=Oryza meyeriana var. granulata TaxID=110450 RepID=A0A6G1CW64_9ORYZ|nr:hypothetical protein E2562_029881 [Oryza meyeriana var. granulata]